MDYKKAGVDIEAGYKSVELMKEHIKKTMRKEVLTNIGGFSGAFSLSTIKDMEEPVLLSGTDGCGTKVKLAMVMDKHDTIGIDAVAMCVNDIACAGGEPLFFLDYIACGKNYPEKIATIVSGVAEGCVQSDAALIGGETAEHPGLMQEDEYDLAGFAVGADEAYIYVRAEYPLAIKRLKIAIEQAEKAGYLGKNIMGSDFNFDIHIKEGAGAFVCGEETALIASIEGERGMPRPKPPFPANKGLFGRPTLINNVETLANVPVIMRKGADWFAQMGTAKSKGTKTFALTGEVNNTGLIEVPMGTTLRQIIFDIGGGGGGGEDYYK